MFFLVVWALYTIRHAYAKLTRAYAEWKVAYAEVFCLELLTRVATQGLFCQQIWRSQFWSNFGYCPATWPFPKLIYLKISYEKIRLRKFAYAMIYHPRIHKVLAPLTQPWEFSGIALTRSFYSSLFFIALLFQKKRCSGGPYFYPMKIVNRTILQCLEFLGK